MTASFVIESFSRAQHDRSAFDCGVPVLNHYIQRQVSSDIRRNLARCTVAVRAERPTQLAGYYTLSAHSVEADLLPESLSQSPYPSVPAVLIGRLAVCQSCQGQALGVQLVVSALRKSLRLHEELGIQLVVVDPLGEEVVAFYERFGFQEFSGGRLLLPLKTVKRALAE